MNFSTPVVSGSAGGSGSGYKEFTDISSPDNVTFRPLGNVASSDVGGSDCSAPQPAMTSLAPQQQQSQQQIVIIQAPKMQRSFSRYAGRWALICGSIQIGTGIASVILGIANAPTCASYGVLGFGIWCGITFIISGSFGVVSSRRKTSCTIIAHMVMSIISSVAAGVQLALAAASAVYDMYYFSPPSIGCYYNVGPYSIGDDVGPDGAVATSALLAVAAILECVIAIIGAAVSCKVICCSSNFVPAQGDVMNGYPAMGQPQSAQVVYYVNQPVIAQHHGQPLPQQQFSVAYGQNTGYGY